jgi:hypothetical protein
MDRVDAVFISHRHRDHVAGAAAERSGELPADGSLPDLRGKPLMSPEPVSYPGANTVVLGGARKLFEGVATTGPITRSLFMGPVDEQALVVNVAGRGLVVIVGCGHQTVPRLLERLESAFAEPLSGMVGDFHYPVPEGRLRVAGLDAQRLFASGNGPFKPITVAQAQAELALLDRLQLLALGGHDTSDEVIAWWERLVGAARSGPEGLEGFSDWATKLALIRAFRERHGLGAKDPRVRMLDLQYHDVRQDRGLYHRLVASGRGERLGTEAEVAHAVTTPPRDTRAWFRGSCIRRFPAAVIAAASGLPKRP